MRQSIAFLLAGLLVLLSACTQAPPPPEKPDEQWLKQQITERFDKAYGGLLELSRIEVKPLEHSLNDAFHQIYAVDLEAVVQGDLASQLKQADKDIERRKRIEGLMSLQAVPGHKIDTHLVALVEFDPEKKAWVLAALLKSTPPEHTQKDTADEK